MNWYPRFPGDYMRDTSHLSLTEHGAYTVMLDHYYSTGNPLPDDDHALIRMCRAFEDHEKQAVKRVAALFFPVNGDGLRHNKRADDELAKADEKSEKARNSAAVRWDQNRNANAMRTHKRTQCSPHPHPESTSRDQTPEPEDESCSEVRKRTPSRSDAAGGDDSPVVFEMPILGGAFPVTQKDADTWRDAFPAVDIEQTLKEMAAWCDANPKRKKTSSGAKRFIVSWLTREQNGGRCWLAETT